VREKGEEGGGDEASEVENAPSVEYVRIDAPLASFAIYCLAKSKIR
jgi:hypothetical protein